MNIRLFNKEDSEKLSKLYSEQWPTTINSYCIDKFLSNGNYLFVAELEDEIIGAATLHLQHKLVHNCGTTGFIENVIVSNEHRRLGVGQKMLDKLIEEAKNKKCYNIVLCCSKHLDVFYEKSGMFKSEQIVMIKTFQENFTY